MTPRDPLKTLFDQLRQADEEMDTAGDALQVAVVAQRRCRKEIWAAIEAGADVQIDTIDLREHITRLETLVLELTAKLNGR
jgi:hypothetical protein